MVDEYKESVINRIRSVERQLENCRNGNKELENEYIQLAIELIKLCEAF